MHHRGDDLRDVLQGKHHQAVGFFVISEVGHAHILANQEFVKVAAEIIDDVEQELVGGIGKNLP